MPPPQAAGNGTLILEEPLIRTPYELLRRSHRAAQRQVEKDFLGVQNVLNGLLKSVGGEVTDTTRQNAVTKLDQATERVRGLKRKLEDLQPNEESPTALRSRLTYLDNLSKPPDAPQGGVSSGAEKEGDNTLDRYIVDYLLRTGKLKSAKAVAARKDIESLVDVKLFAELIKIETALVEKHSVAEALSWCGEHRGTLRKNQNDVDFTLRAQEFIELCRKRDMPAAIVYSRQHLAPWAPTHIKEIRKLMALLAFGEKTGVGMYRSLYDPEQWDHARDEFRKTLLSLYALPGQPLLSLALSAGLSTLRLPSCVKYEPSKPDSPKSPTNPLLPGDQHSFSFASYLDDFASSTRPAPPSPTQEIREANGDGHDDTGADVGNIDCPTCGKDMKVLASEVPMSHHVNSTLVCRISGEVMDDSNPPMTFPNGHVYSANALMDMARNNYGVVTCPQTKESCLYARLRKVYIS